MNRFLFLLVVSLLLVSCKPKQGFGLHISDPDTFIVAFGSCNLHDETNHLWGNVLEARPFTGSNVAIILI